MARVRHQLAPRRRFHAAAEDVWIEGWMRDHREDVAVVGIERNESAVLAGHRLLRGLLQIEIDRHNDILSGLVGDLVEHPEPPSYRVNLDLLSARLAAQKSFADALEPEFSDLVAVMIVGLRDEIVLGDLADVTKQMRCELPVQIMARGRDFETDTRKFQLMCFERDHLLPSDTLRHGDWLVRPTAHSLRDRNFIRDMIPARITPQPFAPFGKTHRSFGPGQDDEL